MRHGTLDMQRLQTLVTALAQAVGNEKQRAALASEAHAYYLSWCSLPLKLLHCYAIQLVKG